MLVFAALTVPSVARLNTSVLIEVNYIRKFMHALYICHQIFKSPLCMLLSLHLALLEAWNKFVNTVFALICLHGSHVSCIFSFLIICPS